MTTIIEAMSDPKLFGKWFDNRTWDAWRVFLRVLFGLTLDDAETELYRACTSRQDAPLVACNN